jgi:hypothetical protein
VSRNHRALVLPAAYQAWETAYAATLVDAGLQVDYTWRWGARAFCARFGDGSGWHALSLEQQLALNPKILRFVAWAIATHRVGPTAAYLIARRAIKAISWLASIRRCTPTGSLAAAWDG